MNLNKKAALLIRSLMGQLRISDHIVFHAEGNITSDRVLEALEGPHVGDREGDGAGGEAALAIAEEAFRAGWAALEDVQGVQVETPSKTVDEAWDAFEPAEAMKDPA